ncbi:hypothetical protein BDQ17DRAFT_176634 [Cyathus striatus]|nr:hypothetical protein BDQ17DRAFT_176634 [Cyathus striatus]
MRILTLDRFRLRRQFYLLPLYHRQKWSQVCNRVSATRATPIDNFSEGEREQGKGSEMDTPSEEENDVGSDENQTVDPDFPGGFAWPSDPAPN